MATRVPTTTFLTAERSVIKFVWSALANGDVGAAVEYADYPYRSVQVSGTFGVGGSIKIEASNNGGVNWATLLDVFAAALVFTVTGLRMFNGLAITTRPSVTAGDGTTNLTVTMIAKKTQ